MDNKDREIQELKQANEQLRQLCIRLQTALEYQSEQLHDVVHPDMDGLAPPL